jgi:hypothetical protein
VEAYHTSDGRVAGELTAQAPCRVTVTGGPTFQRASIVQMSDAVQSGHTDLTFNRTDAERDTRRTRVIKGNDDV